jgi:hypothetical protein
MTITFRLKDHNTPVPVSNLDFNPHEPEDPIYNPRTWMDNIYPEMNMTVSSAVIMLRHIEYLNQSETLLDHGEFYLETIDELSKKCSKFLAINPDKTQDMSLRAKIYRFDKLCRYALALNDTIVWA